MTKKDYVIIADSLSNIYLNSSMNRYTLEDLIKEFSDNLYRDNYKFSISKFQTYIYKRLSLNQFMNENICHDDDNQKPLENFHSDDNKLGG